MKQYIMPSLILTIFICLITMSLKFRHSFRFPKNIFQPQFSLEVKIAIQFVLMHSENRRFVFKFFLSGESNISSKLINVDVSFGLWLKILLRKKQLLI